MSGNIDRARWGRRRALIVVAMLLTVVGAGCVTVHLLNVAGTTIAEANAWRLVEITILYSLFYWMLVSSFIYLLADYGHYKRQAMYLRKPQIQVDAFGDRKDRHPLLILVPSYREEEPVIHQALLSAALVEYSRRRVLLLIDDPPNPMTADEAQGLARSRRLPTRLQNEFNHAAQPFILEQFAFETRERACLVDPVVESQQLARLHERLSDWLEALAAKFVGANHSHTDQLYADKILRAPARMHRERAEELTRVSLSRNEIAAEYRRLASLFDVEFTSFERKRYANLSHAPNKAMNLNTYIALVGKCFREVERADGRHLEVCDQSEATFEVPAAKYIATVDADSFVTADFARHLISIMEAPGNERIAVAQSPYTAISNTAIALERAAAASTDVQFFGHQGMAHFGTSWWVGASALVRREALEDIAVETEERAHKLTVYIQDKILIEDAATTIDLLHRGWRIYHDPGRLCYSATPSDFGTLIIQRRRWSNGGLLIVPGLLRYVFRWPWSLAKFGDGLLRIQNLLSATLNGITPLVLLGVRFDDGLMPLWLSIVALPYYFQFGSDLVLAGYRWRDLPRIYALNSCLLLPVYLAGTWQSIRQMICGRPIPFRRTPKIADRTRTPVIYLLAIYSVFVFSLVCCIDSLIRARYSHALFSLFNGVIALYGCGVLVGFRASWEDFLTGLRSRDWWPRRLLADRIAQERPAAVAELLAASMRRADLTAVIPPGITHNRFAHLTATQTHGKQSNVA
jgi:cellulose synthase (UDP-forming)